MMMTELSVRHVVGQTAQVVDIDGNGEVLIQEVESGTYKSIHEWFGYSSMQHFELMH